MLIKIKGKEIVALNDNYYIISASFHSKFITKNIKNVNHYLNKPNNEELIIFVANNGKDIYLYDADIGPIKKELIDDLLITNPNRVDSIFDITK